jgi:nicotinate-nucleotide pyrophosphorylase (carboxylating)
LQPVRPSYISDSFLQVFISRALEEDVGTGDHTSLAVVPEEMKGHAQLLVKDSGIAAGVEFARILFSYLDPAIKFEEKFTDGQPVQHGDVLFAVHGHLRTILKAERLVLNTLQRMSGIATRTAHLVHLISGTRAKILDTRKTTPQFRLLEKWAVRIGGGYNHRLGLFDAIMIKDNHIQAAGSVEEAILRVKRYLRAHHLDLPVEIEVRTLEELDRVIRTGEVDTIMLDNMNVDSMKEAVRRVAGRFTTEASGGITEETIRPIALTGVDYISVGALTHSVKSLDMSLKIVA